MNKWISEHGADEVSDLLDFEGAELFVPDNVPDHLQETHVPPYKQTLRPINRRLICSSTGLIIDNMTSNFQLHKLDTQLRLRCSGELQQLRFNDESDFIKV